MFLFVLLFPVMFLNLGLFRFSGEKMSIEISEVYGKDIYDTEGKYIGKANDLILDIEESKAVRITTEKLNELSSKQELSNTLKDNSVLYDRVKSISDIVLVGK